MFRGNYGNLVGIFSGINQIANTLGNPIIFVAGDTKLMTFDLTLHGLFLAY